MGPELNVVLRCEAQPHDTFMQTHEHTHTHTHKHKQSHKPYKKSHTLTRTHTDTQTQEALQRTEQKRTHMHTSKHTRTHSLARASAPRREYTCIHIFLFCALPQIPIKRFLCQISSKRSPKVIERARLLAWREAPSAGKKHTRSWHGATRQREHALFFFHIDNHTPTHTHTSKHTHSQGTQT
jgi:hypothetical protein